MSDTDEYCLDLAYLIHISSFMETAYWYNMQKKKQNSTMHKDGNASEGSITSTWLIGQYIQAAATHA